MRLHKLLRIFSILILLLACHSRQADAAVHRRSAAPLKFISLQSDLLTAFWRSPIYIRAAVFEPRKCVQAPESCAILFHIPGYGGTINSARAYVGDYDALGRRFPDIQMVHVFLDPSFHNGFHYFTDSENYGPWNSALTKELVPYLEQKFGLSQQPSARYLFGHSSGAWAAAWLQVSNPTFFNGVWAVAPDPLDFRYFYGSDVTPSSRDNFYYTAGGALRPLNRAHSESLKTLMTRDDNDPSTGGFISSYEFAWSPKGPGGLPERLFDRKTGDLIESTQKAWQSYDVHAVLKAGGQDLKATLAGKLNIYCGGNDDFYYDRSTALLCGFLSDQDYDAVCRIIKGRDHSTVFNPTPLYRKGLRYLILSGAQSRFLAAQAGAQ